MVGLILYLDDKRRKDMKESGIVFNIQHYCVHDGPGIRTNVFLKGCPLRCLWCANPESNAVKLQLMYQSEKCSGCQACVSVCPQQAIGITAHQKTWTDRALCTACGVCASVCVPKAREIAGKMMTVDEICREVEKDRLFYGTDGGVTLTGGEVLSQPEFAAAILKKCRENGIHTAVETCGYASWEAVKQVMEYVDIVLYDVKHMDSHQHKWGTGVGNERILENLERISRELQIPVIVRTPVIPGYNDQESNFHAMGQFVCEKVPTCAEVNLLPYHNMGEGKRLELEAGASMFQTHVPSEDEMEYLRGILRRYGLTIK